MIILVVRSANKTDSQPWLLLHFDPPFELVKVTGDVFLERGN